MPERLRGEVARFDFVAPDGKVIVAKDKRITAKHIRDIDAAGMKQIVVPEDFLVGRVVAKNIVDKETGEIIANANDEITETLLAKLREAGVDDAGDAVHQRTRSWRVHLQHAARR